MAITVLHLVASNFFGGPEKQIIGHALAIARDRVECIVGGFVENKSENALLKRATSLGLRTLALPASYPMDLRQVTRLRFSLREQKVDLLCTHGYRAIIIGLLATTRVKIPVLAYMRGWTAENLKVRFWYTLASHLTRFTDGVITVSEASASKLKRSLRLPDEKISVVYNAIDAEVFDRLSSEDGNLRQEIGIPHDSPLVVSVGRLSPEKGHCYLVEAAKQVLQSFGNVRFVIVGDGPERPRLERQIGDLGLTDHLHLVGFRSDPWRFIGAADLVVLPSLSEGLPNVLLEASAAGRACVATTVGGIPEVATDGVSGLLVPPADPSSLAAAIINALSDDSLRQNLADAARRNVEERFRFDAQARQLERIYARYC